MELETEKYFGWKPGNSNSQNWIACMKNLTKKEFEDIKEYLKKDPGQTFVRDKDDKLIPEKDSSPPKDLSIPNRFVLGQIDDNDLARDELELIEPYRKKCQNLFDETILEDQEEKLVNRFKAILILLRDKNTDERVWHIQLGKKIANSMKTGNIKTEDLLLFRGDVKKKWPEFEGSVVWAVLFPGEPYKQLSGDPDKIGHGFSKDSHNDLREQWWEHHANKWGLLSDYLKEMEHGSKPDYHQAKDLFFDKRVKHGEKDAIIKHWEENKATYLTDEYKFKSSGYYNQEKIARDIKKAGGLTSDTSTIKDHAGLRDL